MKKSKWSKMGMRFPLFILQANNFKRFFGHELIKPTTSGGISEIAELIPILEFPAAESGAFERPKFFDEAIHQKDCLPEKFRVEGAVDVFELVGFCIFWI